METLDPQLRDDMTLGTIVPMPGPGGSRTVIWQARRTIDGWEAMPSVLGGGLQLEDLTAEDFFTNFDAAYLDNAERMYRVKVPDVIGKTETTISEELNIGLEFKRVEGGWLLRNLVPTDE
jgi:hypothetical protein